MFRNGLRNGHRSLTQSLSSMTLSGGPSVMPMRELPFVCLACQRAMSSKTKRGRGTRATNFMGEIARLEQHVARMEKNYKDIIEKKAASEELPDVEITPELTNRAYAALMAPLTTSEFLPAPESIRDLLPAPIVERLSTSLALVDREDLEWGLVMSQLEENGGLEDMTTPDVNKFVACIDPESRAETSAKLLDMMDSADVNPNTFTYDLMMMAHAMVEQPAVVKSLFNQMKERGLKPTVYSYAHLLKAFGQEKDVVNSARSFQEMNSLGIQANLVLYTTLIQTCIKSEELPTAWAIFDLIKFRSTATAPDVNVYTLMIHACAKNGEAERAMDLYTDMTERRELQPNSQTYHALIHACASRPDYFTQAWKFATEMQQQGIKIEYRALNTLLAACGRSGELTRARLLVRHMMAAGKPELAPDEFTFQGLLRAYGSYVPPDEGNKKTPVKGVYDARAMKNDGGFLSQDTKLEKREPGSELPEILPLLPKGVLSTHREVHEESSAVIKWLRKRRPEFFGTQLLNTYLDVLLQQGAFLKLQRCYFTYFFNPSPAKPLEPGATSPQESAPEKESEAEKKLLCVKRNMFTFTTALSAAVKYGDLRFARRIMADVKEFTKTPEYFTLEPKQRKALDFKLIKLMVEVLAKNGYIGEAMGIVQEAVDDGFEFGKADLQTLYVKAVQLEDIATARWVQEITRQVVKRW
ncbi:hypothetical protein RUND412_007934 [Rhizina undulata]